MIDKSEIFAWLVREQIERDLPIVLENVRDGIYHHRGKPIRPGIFENRNYSGILVVANGANLLQELQKDKNVLDTEDIAPPVNVRTYDDFRGYCDVYREEGAEGVAIVDSVNGKITQVVTLNNTPCGRRPQLQGIFPEDFCSIDGNAGRIANRTYVAAAYPLAYPTVETFQIKQTAYTPLGIGKVTHFSTHGLVEEFFLQHGTAPAYINAEHQVFGVHRVYAEELPRGRIERIVTSPEDIYQLS